MAGIFIFLTILVGTIFILSRNVIIKVQKYENFRIELHFPILALILTDRKKKTREEEKLTFRSYSLLFRDVARICENASVLIQSINVGGGSEEFNEKSTLRPYRIHSMISVLIAYLAQNARKLTIEDNALTLAPDSPRGVTFEVTAVMTLFHAAYGALIIYNDIKKTSKKVRNVDVGN